MLAARDPEDSTQGAQIEETTPENTIPKAQIEDTPEHWC